MAGTIHDLPVDSMALIADELDCRTQVNAVIASKQLKADVGVAVYRLCIAHPLYASLSVKKQNQLLNRCDGDWKRVLRFLKAVNDKGKRVPTERGENRCDGDWKRLLRFPKAVNDSGKRVPTEHGEMHLVAGREFTFAIKNGHVFSNLDGHGLTTRLMSGIRPVYFPFSAKVKQLSANEDNVGYVMESGQVFTYGLNASFSCGHGTDKPVMKPKLVEHFWKTRTPCKQVEINSNSTLFLTTEGGLFSVGNNTYGQLGLGDQIDRMLPTAVDSFGTVKAVAGGGFYVLALTQDGNVFSFGSNLNLCLGHGEAAYEICHPKLVETFKDKNIVIVSLSPGTSHATAIDSNGYVYSWGTGRSGALGHGDWTDRAKPKMVLAVKKNLVLQVSAGYNNTFVLLETGVVYGFGRSCFGGRLTQGEAVNHPEPIKLGTSIVQVSSGYDHTVFLSEDGRLYGFGSSGSGELGHEGLRSSEFQQWPVEFSLNSYPPF